MLSVSRYLEMCKLSKIRATIFSVLMLLLCVLLFVCAYVYVCSRPEIPPNFVLVIQILHMVSIVVTIVVTIHFNASDMCMQTENANHKYFIFVFFLSILQYKL